jgi:hypothetical protein
MTGNLVGYFLVKLVSERAFLIFVVSMVFLASVGMAFIPDPQGTQTPYDINPDGILSKPNPPPGRLCRLQPG